MIFKREMVLIGVVSFFSFISLNPSYGLNDEKNKTSTAASNRKLKETSKGEYELEAPDYHQAALVNIQLGLGYLEQGQVARAKTKLTHAIKLAPKLAEPHSAMAYFLETVGEYKEAEEAHKKAVRLSPKGAMYNNLGAFLCRRGRFNEADKAFHAAILDKEYARTAEVYENAGVCALKGLDETKAKDYLTTAVKQDPHRLNALLSLADLSIKQGQFAEAKGFWERHERQASKTPRSLLTGILIGRGLNDARLVENEAFILEQDFKDSSEYQQYLNLKKQ